MKASDLGIEAVGALLQGWGDVAVALSGGIDSITLATIAGRKIGQRARMYHAVSPAVPRAATDRVRSMAEQENWNLHLVDAGEFGLEDYISNPVNRCFYCKQSLYAVIAQSAEGQIVSGTNLDDLGEYRPGLDAAQRAGVRHPFVEAEIGKAEIRSMALRLGLGTLSRLPASPCLSSRVETGISISRDLLEIIHATERMLQSALGIGVVRCRYRSTGVVIELADHDLAALTPDRRRLLTDRIRALFDRTEFAAPVSFAPYRTGSAFLVPEDAKRYPA